MNTKHTQEHWYRLIGSSQIVTDKKIIATINTDLYPRETGPNSYSEAQANARLIAAAPELLAAAQRCLEANLCPEIQDLIALRNAVDKAIAGA